MWLVAQELLAQLEDTKALREVKALQTFFELLNTDQSRAFYGLKHVQAACGRGAVEELLVTDALFRSLDEATRRSYVDLVEEAKAQGANVHVFSSLHVSGEALQEVCGAVGCVAVAVAAWLCGCGCSCCGQPTFLTFMSTPSSPLLLAYPLQAVAGVLCAWGAIHVILSLFGGAARRVILILVCKPCAASGASSPRKSGSDRSRRGGGGGGAMSTRRETSWWQWPPTTSAQQRGLRKGLCFRGCARAGQSVDTPALYVAPASLRVAVVYAPVCLRVWLWLWLWPWLWLWLCLWLCMPVHACACLCMPVWLSVAVFVAVAVRGGCVWLRVRRELATLSHTLLLPRAACLRLPVPSGAASSPCGCRCSPRCWRGSAPVATCAWASPSPGSRSWCWASCRSSCCCARTWRGRPACRRRRRPRSRRSRSSERRTARRPWTRSTPCGSACTPAGCTVTTTGLATTSSARKPASAAEATVAAAAAAVAAAVGARNCPEQPPPPASSRVAATPASASQGQARTGYVRHVRGRGWGRGWARSSRLHPVGAAMGQWAMRLRDTRGWVDLLQAAGRRGRDCVGLRHTCRQLQVAAATRTRASALRSCRRLPGSGVRTK